MPELPDIQNFADNLNRRLSGRTIESVRFFPKAKLNTSEEEIRKALQGASIRSVRRDGKELSFFISNGDVLNVHLMLNGEIHLLEDEAGLDDLAGKVAVFALSSELLVFSDFQKQLQIRLNPEPAAAPDALSEDFTWDYFVSRVKERARKNIKSFLLDQEVVRGIGSAYADEILYESGISPRSTAGFIPETNLECLHSAIPCVLTGATEKIRQIQPDRISGEERSFLKVHNDSLKRTEKGEPILVRQIASRKTYYTEEQEVFQ